MLECVNLQADLAVPLWLLISLGLPLYLAIGFWVTALFCRYVIGEPPEGVGLIILAMIVVWPVIGLALPLFVINWLLEALADMVRHFNSPR